MQQKQHVDFYRKILLRKNLIKHAEPGLYYVPFIGDGDIAHQLYFGKQVYGADTDSKRIEIARARLSNATIRVADCNNFPFVDIDKPFALADFDAYSEPYISFRAFWWYANKTNRLVLLFTDGHKQGIMRTGHWHRPDGSKAYLETANDRRLVFNFYFQKHILPWFTGFVQPYKVVKTINYLRGMMLYWGAVIDNAETGKRL